MTYSIRPEARADIIEQLEYYESNNVPHVAERFADSVASSVQLLCTMPHMGALTPTASPALSGLRSWPVQNFSDVLIFYLMLDDEMVVARVLHSRRHVQAILDAAEG